ncbi:MAG: hypothetical protein ACR2M6_00010 [Vampirovibrionia bacterium]
MTGKYVNTDKGRRWQNADGTYAYVKPGGGRQFGAGLVEFIAPGTNQRTAELDQKNKDLSGNPVRPSQPDGEPTAYAQHGGGTTYYESADGRSVYNLGGVNYDYATGQQVFRNKATSESITHDGAFSVSKAGGTRGYEGTNYRNTDDQIVGSGTQVWKVPDSTLKTGGGGGNRDNGRVIPGSGGKVQKGTDMSRSFNDLLATTNTSGYQPFSSNQLPSTAASPDSKMSPMTQAITNIGPVADGQEYANNLGRQGTSGIGPVADGQVYGNTLENAAGAGTKGIGPLADGAAYAKAVEGKGKSTSRLDAALSDTAGINSYMSKFSSGDQERLANRAFLDTKGSMEGLRAKEAVNGVVYAQGQHYVAGESADSPAQKITRDNARDISGGQAKAQDFLKSKIDTTIDTQKQTPAEAQDPLSAAGSAVKSGFAAGAQTDFSLNNNQSAPQAGVGPVVPTDQIPKDLSGAAGKKYLADLDAGRLFK